MRVTMYSTSIAGLVLDVIGTFFGLIDMAILARDQGILENIKRKMDTLSEDHDESVRSNFTLKVTACRDRSAFIGHIPLAALTLGIILFIVALMCFTKETQPRVVFIAAIVTTGTTVLFYVISFIPGFIRYLMSKFP
jgi:hypothetical protein